MTLDQGGELTVLLESRETLEGEIALRKQALEQINIAIGVIAKPLADAVYQREGKTDGTIKFALGNRIYKSEVRKTVSYDNDKLLSLAGSLPWEQAREVFKFKAEVPEKVFKALADETLKARIVEARSVKYSEPKISAED